MNQQALAIVLLFSFGSFGCHELSARKNKATEAKAIAVMKDLRENGESSQFYRQPGKWTEVSPNVRVLTSQRWQVSCFHEPMGPTKVFDVETGEVSYDE